MAEEIIQSKIKIKNSTLEDIAEIALNSLYPNKESKTLLSVNDVSGNSGAKTYICHEGDVPKCIVCLLYTSPSPRDRQKSRMPSSA